MSRACWSFKILSIEEADIEDIKDDMASSYEERYFRGRVLIKRVYEWKGKQFPATIEPIAIITDFGGTDD